MPGGTAAAATWQSDAGAPNPACIFPPANPCLLQANAVEDARLCSPLVAAVTRAAALGAACHARAPAFLRCVELLVAAGADVRLAAKDGSTALHAAAQGGSLACCDLLLDAGAALDAPDAAGRTPLAAAAAGRAPHPRCVLHLLGRGAAVASAELVSCLPLGRLLLRVAGLPECSRRLATCSSVQHGHATQSAQFSSARCACHATHTLSPCTPAGLPGSGHAAAGRQRGWRRRQYRGIRLAAAAPAGCAPAQRPQRLPRLFRPAAQRGPAPGPGPARSGCDARGDASKKAASWGPAAATVLCPPASCPPWPAGLLPAARAGPPFHQRLTGDRLVLPSCAGGGAGLLQPAVQCQYRRGSQPGPPARVPVRAAAPGGCQRRRRRGGERGWRRRRHGWRRRRTRRLEGPGGGQPACGEAAADVDLGPGTPASVVHSWLKCLCCLNRKEHALHERALGSLGPTPMPGSLLSCCMCAWLTPAVGPAPSCTACTADAAAVRGLHRALPRRAAPRPPAPGLPRGPPLLLLPRPGLSAGVEHPRTPLAASCEAAAPAQRPPPPADPLSLEEEPAIAAALRPFGGTIDELIGCIDEQGQLPSWHFVLEYREVRRGRRGRPAGTARRCLQLLGCR